MQRIIGIAAAVVLIALGVLWTLQGLGYVGGGMSENRTFAVVGPILAGFGVALGIVVVQAIRRR